MLIHMGDKAKEIRSEMELNKLTGAFDFECEPVDESIFYRLRDIRAWYLKWDDGTDMTYPEWRDIVEYLMENRLVVGIASEIYIE